MKRRYIFTLEILPLEVGRTYEVLPSHLTLMSRFWSELSPKQLSDTVQLLFAGTTPLELVFDETVELGPKKVLAHMVQQPDELRLHKKLCSLLDTLDIEYEYPEFVGDAHKAHVTKREGVHFASRKKLMSNAAYLIEIVDKQRLVRTRYELKNCKA